MTKIRSRMLFAAVCLLSVLVLCACGDKEEIAGINLVRNSGGEVTFDCDLGDFIRETNDNLKFILDYSGADRLYKNLRLRKNSFIGFEQGDVSGSTYAYHFPVDTALPTYLLVYDSDFTKKITGVSISIPYSCRTENESAASIFDFYALSAACTLLNISEADTKSRAEAAELLSMLFEKMVQFDSYSQVIRYDDVCFYSHLDAESEAEPPYYSIHMRPAVDFQGKYYNFSDIYSLS